jgi:hypothetical protein
MVYNLFISHSWSYSDQYERLEKLLREYPYFQYKDFSVPKDDPIHNAPNERLLTEAIQRQMRPTSAVLILAGVYGSYSKWINIEIELAKKGFVSPKPVIAIQPWGAERTSVVVRDAADEVVGWNAKSVVEAIRRVA